MEEAVEEKDAKFTLRIPPELHAIITREAERNRRTLNSEILSMVEDSMKHRQSLEAIQRRLVAEGATLWKETRSRMDVLAETDRQFAEMEAGHYYTLDQVDDMVAADAGQD